MKILRWLLVLCLAELIVGDLFAKGVSLGIREVSDSILCPVPIQITVSWESLFGFLKIPKEWKGIKPLHSTREDVERVLQVKSSGKALDEFKVDDSLIQVRYSTKSCKDRSNGGVEGWDVPSGTVVSILVIPQATILFPELEVSKSEFDIYPTDVVGVKVYKNNSSGFELEVDEKTGKVQYFWYYWGKNDEHLRCAVKK